MPGRSRVRWRGRIAVDLSTVQRVIERRGPDEVRRQVGAGEDRRGRPMRSYTPEYAARRARDGLPSGRVTLRRTGSLLRALRVALRRRGRGRRRLVMTVSADQLGKARGLSGRRWLGLSRQARKLIRREIETARGVLRSRGH